MWVYTGNNLQLICQVTGSWGGDMATNLPSSSLIIFLILKQLVFLIHTYINPFPHRAIQDSLSFKQCFGTGSTRRYNLFGWNRSGTTFFKRIAAFKSSIANNNHYSFDFLQLLMRLSKQNEWKWIWIRTIGAWLQIHERFGIETRRLRPSTFDIYLYNMYNCTYTLYVHCVV